MLAVMRPKVSSTNESKMVVSGRIEPSAAVRSKMSLTSEFNMRADASIVVHLKMSLADELNVVLSKAPVPEETLVVMCLDLPLANEFRTMVSGWVNLLAVMHPRVSSMNESKMVVLEWTNTSVVVRSKMSLTNELNVQTDASIVVRSKMLSADEPNMAWPGGLVSE